MAFQSWNKYCDFQGCSVYLNFGQGHFVRDQPHTHPNGRALCDQHYQQVQQMRKNARRKKRIGLSQPQLPILES